MLQVRKFIKSIKYFYLRNSLFLNIISIKAFANIIKIYKVSYRSKILNHNFNDSIKIYKTKDILINKNFNCIFKNNVVTGKNKNPLILESVHNQFYFNALEKLNIYELIFRKKPKLINIKKDVFYFEISENKPNYYHFIVDNFIGLVFFLENYKKDFVILYNGSVANYINKYLELISLIYKKKIIKINADENIVNVKNNFIFADKLNYAKMNTQTVPVDKSNYTPYYALYKFPHKFKKKDGTFIYNHAVDFLSSKNTFDSVDDFIKKLFDRKIIKKKKKENYYIKRLTGNGYKKRSIFEEEKLIKFLKERNFKTISFENMPVIKQIEIMVNSKTVVSIYGSNTTNFIYKSKKEKIIEIYPYKRYFKADHFKHIFEQRNLNFYALNCEGNKKEELLIDYKKLDKLINS